MPAMNPYPKYFQPATESTLYYEGHITLAPFIGVPGNFLEESMEVACQMCDMRLSTFLMAKEGQEQPDAFVSLRSDDYKEMCDRIWSAVNYLKSRGHVVKRYKIESIIMDSRRQDDPLNLGVPRANHKQVV